jgi:hypothetical protein
MELERDEFETVAYDDERGILELAWTEASANLTDQLFMDALERFGRHAEDRRARNVLIDVTRFAFQPGPQVGPWRDEHVIPKYNRAGVQKFAFLVPEGSPGTVESGAVPAPEPPGAFPTGYFDARGDIDAWFASVS